MAIGKVGAYATDAPIAKNYIGEAMSQVEESSARLRAEGAQMVKLKQEQEAAREKQTQDSIDKNTEGLQSVTTPMYNVNNIQQAVGQEAYNTVVENSRKLSDPKLSEAEKQQARLKIHNAKQSFANLKGQAQILMDKVGSISKNADDYNPTDMKDLQETVKSMSNMDVSKDANGNITFNTYETDDKGQPVLGPDGKPKKVIDGAGIDYVLGQFDRFAKPQYNNLLKSYYANNKPELKVKVDPKDKNRTISEIEPTQANLDNARNLAVAVANNPSEAYQKWIDMGNPKKREFNEDDKKKIEEYVYNETINGLKNEYKEKYNVNAEIASERLAMQRDYNNQSLELRKNIYQDNKASGGSGGNSDVGYKTVTREVLTAAGKAKRAFNEKNAAKIASGEIKKKPIYDEDYEKVTVKVKIKNPPKKTAPKGGKTIKRSDIAAKAKASGYSAKEYEQLLIKNGVKIQ